MPEFEGYGEEPSSTFRHGRLFRPSTYTLVVGGPSCVLYRNPSRDVLVGTESRVRRPALSGPDNPLPVDIRRRPREQSLYRTGTALGHQTNVNFSFSV